MQRLNKNYIFNFTKKYYNDINTFIPDNTFPNNNKFVKNLFNSINRVFKTNYDDMTNLHRWCNTTSPKYKYSCDWKKKLDNAGRDNCCSK